MDAAIHIDEQTTERGVFNDFNSADSFILAFSFVNSMNTVGEAYKDTLDEQCIQSLKFLNIYASKMQTTKEDVSALLLDFGLSNEIIPNVVDRVLELSREYRSIVDSFIQSLSSYRLIDFDWSLRLIMCDGNSKRLQIVVVRVTLKLKDKKQNQSTVVFELTQPELQRLLEMFDSIDHTLGIINVNM